jgi:hypothetical protein
MASITPQLRVRPRPAGLQIELIQAVKEDTTEIFALVRDMHAIRQTTVREITLVAMARKISPHVATATKPCARSTPPPTAPLTFPETIGGTRNEEYRFCWLRDSALTLYALLNAGYRREAEDWRQWLLRAVAGRPEQLQITYGIAGERRLAEFELDGSRDTMAAGQCGLATPRATRCSSMCTAS